MSQQKMSHFNTEHIRGLSVEELARLAVPLLQASGVEAETEYLHAVLNLCRKKLKSLADLSSFIEYFFNDDFIIDESVKKKLLGKGDVSEKLNEVLGELKKITEFSVDVLDNAIEELAGRHGRKKFDYFPLLRLAVGCLDRRW